MIKLEILMIHRLEFTDSIIPIDLSKLSDIFDPNNESNCSTSSINTFSLISPKLIPIKSIVLETVCNPYDPYSNNILNKSTVIETLCNPYDESITDTNNITTVLKTICNPNDVGIGFPHLYLSHQLRRGVL